MEVWLFVASEKRELKGLLRRVKWRRLDWPLEFAAEVEKNGDRWLVVANGPGAALAGRAADAAHERERKLDRLIGIGFCGAIDPALRVGDIVSETLYVQRVAVTAAEKRALGAANQGAGAVEMESAALRERAGRWGIPFAQVRAVSDTAETDLPLDFNALRDAEGRFDRGRIVWAALGRPWSAIPGLARLDRDCRQASESLGEFLAGWSK